MTAQAVWEDALDAIGISERIEVYERHLAEAPEPGAPGSQYLAGFIMGQAQARQGLR